MGMGAGGEVYGWVLFEVVESRGFIVWEERLALSP